jgi:hypothetical protein
MDYCKKYTPQKSKDILCNYKTINDIKDFLKNFEDNPKKKIEEKILLLLGSSGSCKTTICKTIFNECNYEPIKIDMFSNGNLKDNIIQGLQHNTLDCFFSKKKKILFLDDIDLICQYEKSFISFIIKLIKNTKIPIICTSNIIEDKKISEIKKKATKIYIKKIGYKECFQFIYNIVETESINLDLDKLLNIIKQNNNDIRLILTNLNKYIDNSDDIDCNLSNKDTYIDYGLFDFIKEIYSRNLTNNELTSIIHNDVSLISLLSHENILNEYNKVKNKSTNKINILNSYINILDYYTKSDLLEKYNYINNDWYLYDFIYILKIYSINYEINKFDRIDKGENLIFTQLLTKSSLRYNYKKKKRNLFAKLNYDDNNNSTDYIFQLLLQYIKNPDSPIIFNKDDIDCITKYAEVFNLINKDDRKTIMTKNKKSLLSLENQK